MTQPRLIACYFRAGQDGQWLHLARALAHSAGEQCAQWKLDVRAIAPARLASARGVPGDVYNTQKLDHWHEMVRLAVDGDRLLLIDVDTMILRPLDDVWERAFDLAYTTKEARFPFNGGVVFVRVSPRVRQFMTAWRDENRRMLGDGPYHDRWRKKFGGLNQAAFGCLLTQGGLNDLDLLKLPCLEWNCEDSAWARFDPAVTRIVHLKGQLRRACFQRPTMRPAPELAPLVDRWRALDARAIPAPLRRAS